MVSEGGYVDTPRGRGFRCAEEKWWEAQSCPEFVPGGVLRSHEVIAEIKSLQY